MDRNNRNWDESEIALKEMQLANKLQSVLIKEYGYSSKQIKFEVPLGPDSDVNADLIVSDKNKLPIIAVEIKNGAIVLPLATYQLKEILQKSNARFGLIYNGLEKLAYRRMGNSIVRIKDIPNAKNLKKSTLDKYPLNIKPVALPVEEIWRMADSVRGDFYEYNPLLQALALKILDEQKFGGKLFKKFLNKPMDEKDLDQLLQVGKQNFPILFSSRDYIYRQYKDKLIQLFYTIGQFSLQKSNIETITQVITKFGNRYSPQFPEELSNFMLNLLSVQENKKILVPYGGEGYYFHISNFLKKNLNLTKQVFGQYLENYVAITESNLNRLEIMHIISLLRQEPFRLIGHDFMKLEKEVISNFQYVFCILPLGMEVHAEAQIDRELGYLGRQLINYLLVKLQTSHSKSKAAIIVPPSFLFSQSSSPIRRSIMSNRSLKAIIQLPHGILRPYTNITAILIVLDFHTSDAKKSYSNDVFLSQIPEADNDHKFNSSDLNKVLINYKKFERGETFKQSSRSFVLRAEKLEESWTIIDKTPEMRKMYNIPYGTKLSEVGRIFYGKSGDIGIESGRKNTQMPYLRISDIKDGLINSPVQKSIPVKDTAKYSDFKIEEGDVIISCQGTIGKVALVMKKDAGILASPQIAVIRPDKTKVLPEFLIQALNSENVQHQLKTKSQGTFISRLNKDDLNSVIIPTPPLSMQTKSVINFLKERNKIESLERELQLAKKKLLKISLGD